MRKKAVCEGRGKANKIRYQQRQNQVAILESEPLTAPVKRVKDSGAWVTVIDRGLSEAGIEDLYVAGDNPGFGVTSGIKMTVNTPPM